MSYSNLYDKKSLASLISFLRKPIVSSTPSSVCHFTSIITTSIFIHSHNHCLIFMFFNVASQPSSTFSPFSHYLFLVLMFHYSYLQCRLYLASVLHLRQFFISLCKYAYALLRIKNVYVSYTYNCSCTNL